MGLIPYGIALLLDTGVIALRVWLVTRLFGTANRLIFGFGPLGVSLASLLGLPSGGLLTRAGLGPRQPSMRERYGR